MEPAKGMERRFKMLRLSPEDILSVFSDWRQLDKIRLPLFFGLPEGYVVIGVNYVHESDSFMLKIFHESFNIVLEGRVPPYFRSQFELIDLKQKEANV